MQETIEFIRYLCDANGGQSPSRYAAGDKIYTTGDPAESLFFIASGVIKLIVISKSGQQAVIGILKQGDFFGEECLLAWPNRRASATAMSECTVMRVSGSDVVRFLNLATPFSERFVAYLLGRKVQVEEDLADQLLSFSEKRLARTLLMLTSIGPEPESQSDLPKITQETLASVVGTTRQRISLLLNKLHDRGSIVYEHGRITRIDRLLLNRLINIQTHVDLRAGRASRRSPHAV